MEWTEETISRLRALWDEGLSTAEIGRQLSITKNAVVGKAHRLGLPSRPSPIRRASASKDGTVEAKTESTKNNKKKVAKKEDATKIEEKELVADQEDKTKKKVAEKPSLKEKKSLSTSEEMIEPEKVKEPSAPPKKAETRKSGIPLVKKQKDVVLQFTRKASNCCWPIGDPGTKGFHFCGAEAIPGKPYCVEHAQIAYVKLRDRGS